MYSIATIQSTAKATPRKESDTKKREKTERRIKRKSRDAECVQSKACSETPPFAVGNKSYTVSGR
jgi:hypothetical protein